MTQQLRKEIDVGRNKLCPCGSKIKYKKCCLKKMEENERIRIQLMREVKILKKAEKETSE